MKLNYFSFYKISTLILILIIGQACFQMQRNISVPHQRPGVLEESLKKVATHNCAKNSCVMNNIDLDIYLQSVLDSPHVREPAFTQIRESR